MSSTAGRLLFFVVLVGFEAALAQPPQPTPPPKTEIREIKAIGCVRKAAAARCLLLVTLDGETTYSFIAAPKPELGAVITIQGVAHRGPQVCKQGIQVDITDWESTGDKCAE